jgi:hypothetical protein
MSTNQQTACIMDEAIIATSVIFEKYFFSAQNMFKNLFYTQHIDMYVHG